MTRFKSFEVLQLAPRCLTLKWAVENIPDGFAEYVNIFRSESPNGPWEPIASDLTSREVFFDHDAAVFHPHLTVYYKLEGYVQNIADPSIKDDIVASKVEYLRSKPDAIANEIVRRQNLLLARYNGTPGYFLIKKTWGASCTVCYDKELDKIMSSDCSNCYGTKYIGGFYSPIPGYCSADNTGRTVTRVDDGIVLSDPRLQLWTTNTPELKKGDVWVDAQGKRWVVEGVALRTTRLRSVIRQIFIAFEIPANDVIYDIPVPSVFELQRNRDYHVWMPITASAPTPASKIPSILGMTQAEAETAITNAGFVVGSVDDKFSQATVGNVISQAPASGVERPDGSPVSFTLSKGPEYGSVPSVVGMDQSTAETTLTAAGFILGPLLDEYSETVASGVVIRQAVQAGTIVKFGEAVGITLSLGPAPDEYGPVPDVSSMDQATAEAEIVGAGFVVGSVTALNSSTVPLGTVMTQSPQPGSELVFGQPVNIGVSNGLDVLLGQPFGEQIQDSDDPVERTVVIRNPGTEALSISSVSTPAWLTASGVPASVPAGDSAEFTLVLDTSTIGDFDGTVTVSTNAGDALLPVTAEVVVE